MTIAGTWRWSRGGLVVSAGGDTRAGDRRTVGTEVRYPWRVLADQVGHRESDEGLAAYSPALVPAVVLCAALTAAASGACTGDEPVVPFPERRGGRRRENDASAAADTFGARRRQAPWCRPQRTVIGNETASAG